MHTCTERYFTELAKTAYGNNNFRSCQLISCKEQFRYMDGHRRGHCTYKDPYLVNRFEFLSYLIGGNSTVACAVTHWSQHDGIVNLSEIGKHDCSNKPLSMHNQIFMNIAWTLLQVACCCMCCCCRGGRNDCFLGIWLPSFSFVVILEI